jgi:alkylation response protein AidB-like acyl-CoA dehydrogenase
MTVVETLARGCLTTTFVWVQHHSALAAVANAAPGSRDLVEPMCRGELRAGIAFAALRRPGPPLLTATAHEGGWVLHGTAPWVSGWGMIDLLYVGARDAATGDVVWGLLDTGEGPSLVVEPLTLSVAQASATVSLHFDGHLLPTERVTLVEPWQQWFVRDAAGLRPNGALGLGVASRCDLLLHGRFTAEIAAVRSALWDADAEQLPEARAAVALLAHRAAATLVVLTGGRAILTGDHAQRLAREATFLLVAGQTSAIRQHQLTAIT